MASEWITGAFGAGGAAIGASATLAANWLTGRTQEKLERAKRGGANIDLRRTVCAEFLASVYSYIDKTRELIDAAYTRRDDSAADAAREAYMIEWERSTRRLGQL
ncbi:hypothetical protein [Amycolatopsis sp. cg13]|uniref:hypothetical protein n=1 Tax=Amycolatopsis sp. cg13 TaxID=3238807 RepID=UPI0035269DB3